MNKETFFVYEVLGQSNVKRISFTDENGEKCSYPEAQLELKQPGKFSVDNLTAKLWGKAALHPFKKGDLVAVQLRFHGYHKDGNYVNNIVVYDIKLVKDLDYQYL